jgi:beta-ribofuranosylaminobenzene 5'-phosphate synthase
MSIVVTSPSRLHFSLIDLNGELGRVDGGIGVALNEPSLKIEVSAVDEAFKQKKKLFRY